MSKRTASPKFHQITLTIAEQSLATYRREAQELGYPLHLWIEKVLLDGADSCEPYTSEAELGRARKLFRQLKAFKRSLRRVVSASPVQRRTSTGRVLRLIRGEGRPRPSAAAAAVVAEDGCYVTMAA